MVFCNAICSVSVGGFFFPFLASLEAVVSTSEAFSPVSSAKLYDRYSVFAHPVPADNDQHMLS